MPHDPSMHLESNRFGRVAGRAAARWPGHGTERIFQTNAEPATVMAATDR
jgi:hypothetical protein